MDKERSLEPIETGGEMRRIFPTLDDLFEFAHEQGLDEYSFSQYEDADVEGGKKRIRLPDKFKSLVEGNPEDFFVVAYDDRRSNHNAEGTRGQLVKLSTVQKKSLSEERIREIDLEKLDPALGNRARFTTTDSINNESFASINTASEGELEQPHGLARHGYEITPAGVKKKQTSEFNRLDEGMFQWREEEKPVRWVRDLTIDVDDSDETEIKYKELFIIGRFNEGSGEERADIRTSITGTLEDPKSILVEIGFGPMSLARVIYEDEDNSIKVVEHEGVNAYKNQLEILRQDPNYASLVEGNVDPEELLENIRLKANMLREDWDKPTNIFTKVKAIEEKPREIE